MRRLGHVRGSFSAIILCLSSACSSAQSDNSQVQIEEVILTNVNSLSVSAQDQLRSSLEGQTFTRNELSEVSNRVKDAYQQEGFFQVKVAEQQVTDLGGEPLHHVSVTVPIASEGRRFTLATITFINNKQFSTDQLRSAFPINDGDVFDTAKIRAGLGAIRVIYGDQGFVTFTPVPDTQVTESAGTVSLVVDLDEGKRFVYGKLGSFTNVPPTMASKVRDFWREHEGQPYRPNEWREFINSAFADERHIPGCGNIRLDY